VTERFANNPLTTLAVAITTTAQTTISVVSAVGFPSLAQYRILIDSEIMLVTAGAGTTSWTVTRGAESTVAATHLVNAEVAHILTAGALVQFGANITAASTLPVGSTTGDIIRYNTVAGAWEVASEPFSFKGLVLTPALASLVDAIGAIYFDSALKAVLVCTDI
jgi:hypothetical protein